MDFEIYRSLELAMDDCNLEEPAELDTAEVGESIAARCLIVEFGVFEKEEGAGPASCRIDISRGSQLTILGLRQ